MSSFTIAAQYTLEAEGGYGFTTTDLGGETNWGISKRSYPYLDIKNLTQEEALEIYKRDYWMKYRVAEINDQCVANQVFDMFFNMNYTNAANCVQKAVRNWVDVAIDGVVGDKTFRAINCIDPRQLLNAIRIERMRHFLRRATDNKTQVVNLPSWLRRTLNDYKKTG